MSTSSNLAEKMEASEKSKGTVVPFKREQAVDPLDELLYRKPIRQHISEFGAIFGIVFLIAAGYSMLKHHSFFSAGMWFAAALAVVSLGYLAPNTLKIFWKGWLAIGEAIGKVVTFVLLGGMWLAMFIPFSIGLKIIGKSVMNMNFKEPRASYWDDRDPADNDFSLLERQY